MMEFPLVFHIGPAKLSAHLLFETMAFFIGFRYFLFLRKRQGDHIVEDHRVWIFIGATAGALLGSRLLGAMESPSAFLESQYKLLYLFSAKTIVGGLLGGLFGVELVKKIIGEKRSSGDLFTYPLLLGMIIGRIGCFLNGTAESVVGIETSSWPGMDLGDGRLRHPVALYEIVFLVILWGLLHIKGRREKWEEGYRFRYFMIAYLGFRFFLEFIKPREPLLMGLSAIQLACIAGWMYYSGTIKELIFNSKNIYLHAKHP